MANLIRRIIRICNIVGNTNPICFVLCSATIREPEVFGARLIGRPIDKVIDRHGDTSERHSKKLVFIGKKRPGQPVRQFAKGVIDLLLSKHRLYTIAFQESIPSVQRIHNELQKSLTQKGLPEDTSSVFTANFLSDEKSKKLNDLRLKKIKGIISTSALALGIDIGSLSASVLITYPGTISKAWQMLGRAGRRGSGLQVFLVGENFLDQYWAKNAAHFVNRDQHLEEMIINPDNEYVLEEHLIAANYDYPLDAARDRKVFGPLFDKVLKKISTNGNAHLFMKRENGREVFNFRDSTGKKVFEISLRGTGKFKIPVYENSIYGRKLLEEDQVRSIRTLYPGAIIIHGGRFWKINDLTYDKGQYGKNGKFHAVATKAGQDEMITIPEVTSDIAVESTEDISSQGPLTKSFGCVNITTRVDNYYLVPYESDKDPDEQGTSENGTGKKGLKRLRVYRNGNTPSEHEYSTEGLWLEVPDSAKSGLEGELLEKALFTAAKAIVKAIPIHQYAVPEDIKFEIFSSHPATGNNAAIFLYENQAGGVGIARRTYEIIGDLLKEAYNDVLTNCPRCSSVKDSKGCPACVADILDRHDRQLGMEILKTWITQIHKQSKAVSTSKILPIDPSEKTELPVGVQC